jgi:hypothetical protein
MRKDRSSFIVVLLLILLSAMIYAVQIIFFRAWRDTGFYLLQDLAFLPLQIAIVTVVLGKYLGKREKAERLRKINVIINAFFSEAGADLLANLIMFSRNRDDIGSELDFQTGSKDNDFLRAIRYLEKEDIHIECGAEQLESLKERMISSRESLIGIIENPNLLEHDTFTDMLLAVFHVTEELMARREFSDNHKADMAHISNDVKRALKALLIQWVEYMRHLQTEYPYLYSLEVRKNPFFKDRSVEFSD